MPTHKGILLNLTLLIQSYIISDRNFVDFCPINYGKIIIDMKILLIYNSRRNSMNKQLLSTLLIIGCSISGIINAKNTPEATQDIFKAARENNTARLQDLINQGANINIKQGGITPLHAAVGKKALEATQLLVSNGADINAQDDRDKMTPLHRSIIARDSRIAIFLINQGANVNIQDKYGKTPLHRAVEQRLYFVAQLLLQKGANRNIQNKKRETPLDIARAQEDQDMILLLTQPPLVPTTPPVLPPVVSPPAPPLPKPPVARPAAKPPTPEQIRERKEQLKLAPEIQRPETPAEKMMRQLREAMERRRAVLEPEAE